LREAGRTGRSTVGRESENKFVPEAAEMNRLLAGAYHAGLHDLKVHGQVFQGGFHLRRDEVPERGDGSATIEAHLVLSQSVRCGAELTAATAATAGGSATLPVGAHANFVRFAGPLLHVRQRILWTHNVTRVTTAGGTHCLHGSRPHARGCAAGSRRCHRTSLPTSRTPRARPSGASRCRCP
jgi:hypothetical protein